MAEPHDPPWDWAEVHARCLREARRFLNGPDAEDAAQEAAIRAWSRRQSCRSPEARDAWVSQIARNEALRVLARRREGASLELAEDEPAPPGSDPVTRLDVLAALGELSESERMLTAMRYFADMSQPRIAEVLGMPEGTTRVQLHRVRGKLRTALKGYE